MVLVLVERIAGLNIVSALLNVDQKYAVFIF